MIYFLIQLQETMITHKIFLFECFVIYVWLIWMIKWAASRNHKDRVFDSGNVPKSSIIVPLFNEDPYIFERAMIAISKNIQTETIVVLDKNETSKKLEQIATEYADKVLRCNVDGKRAAVFLGAQNATGSVLILLDSDTILRPDTIKNLLSPFTSDEKIGGVTSRQHIINPKANMVSRFCEWMENVRFGINMPAQSKFGQVGCLPGRAIALRKEILLNHAEEFLNQKFMGNVCNSGDDRVVTSYALRDGYDTLYQSSAVAYTDCPKTLSEFVRQQIRWARSSQRETILSLPWLWKKPFTFMCFTTDIITPVFFAIVILSMGYNYMFGISYFDIPFLASVVIGIIGMNISLGVRQYPHLLKNKCDIIYLPIYTLFMTVFMTPIRIIGLLTMHKTAWMTRDKTIDENNR